MRDLMMLGAMLVMVPLSFMNAFAAFILWGWTGVVTPVNYLYGFMQSVRFNLLFALITLCMILFTRVRLSGCYTGNRTAFLLILFAIHVSLCALFAYGPNPLNIEYYSNLIKIMVFILLMPIFLNSRLRIHAFLIMIVLGLGLHGTLEGLKYLASGGGHRVLGIPASMLSDNNHFAVAITMGLPFAYYLYMHSARWLVKTGFLCATFLMVIAVIGTYSRGAFLCMCIVGVWLIMTSRNRVTTACVVIFAAAGVMSLAADTWFSRISTIQEASQDRSFMERAGAWRTSSAIALANPVFGGGLHALQTGPVWERFRGSSGLLPFVGDENVRETAMAAHSIYFEVLGDTGIVGLLLFLLLLANAFRTCAQIKKELRDAPPELWWAKDLASLLSAVLVAYMIGGASVSLAYFELPYMIIMLIEVLRRWVITNRIPEAVQHE